MTRLCPCLSSNLAPSATRLNPGWPKSCGQPRGRIPTDRLIFAGWADFAWCATSQGAAPALALDEPVAQVDAAHLGVGQDLVRGAFEQHFARRDDRGAIDDVQRLAHIVVGDQDADPAALQIAD